MGIKVKIIEKSKPGHPEEKYFSSRRSIMKFIVKFIMFQNLIFSERKKSNFSLFTLHFFSALACDFIHNSFLSLLFCHQQKKSNKKMPPLWILAPPKLPKGEGFCPCVLYLLGIVATVNVLIFPLS
ncbi:MAG: hypothetical protein GX612_01065, partial [Bacteroidales bacterium]|nr:hypothetical protein [Bacteroidales bacterium]